MNSKILIVDDEESIRLGFQMILSDMAYDVTTAADYYESIKLLSTTEPDLIISDIILGQQTGIDLLGEVKRRELNCPMIMITGDPNIDTSAEAVRLGAFDYIPKPIKKDSLLRIVHNALRHKKLLDKKLALEAENLRVRHNMEAIFRSVEEGVLSVDNHFNIMEANTSLEEICGFSSEMIAGKNFETVERNCSSKCLQVLKETLKSGKSVKVVRAECKRLGKSSQVVLLTGTPLRLAENKPGGAILFVKNITKLTCLEQELAERHRFHNIIGKNIEMEKIYRLLEDMSEIDSTVLITGETGTGKELFADAVHYNSLRKDKPFIKVNCSALSESLLESELFGHVKGAFTGAVKDKKGRFEMANQGTLFLDELGDISPLTQLKLLRVLQEREFERVGDSNTLKVDVRIIAATNCDLKKKVKQGEFREDLYYRIKVVNLTIPPLRDRREDIPLLADHFLDLFNKRFKKQVKTLSNGVINAFMSYSWPGNIRELEHAVEHGFVLGRDDTISFKHLPIEIKDYFKSQAPASLGKSAITKEDILTALEKTKWNKSKAASLLGIARRTIYRRIEEFDIKNT